MVNDAGKVFGSIEMPVGGWIKAIRLAIGMSLTNDAIAVQMSLNDRSLSDTQKKTALDRVVHELLDEK